MARRWENGTVQPTVRQLRLLANATKRPLAIFYLAEPPRGFTALRDFRRLPGASVGVQTPALRLAVRVACERRQLALDLATDLDELPPPLPIQAYVEEPVADVARRIRDLLGISIQEQKRWKDSYAALNGWRHAAQQRGVLVFQARGVDVSEMRGFSVTEEPMPLIVLNTKDAPNGRVFTLLHEFCHLLLRKGGICDLKDRGQKPEENPIEVFCNRVAAETLVPRRAFAQSPVVRTHPPGTEWQLAEVATLAREFSVSREVVLRRLLTMGRLTRSAYRAWRHVLREEYEATQGSQTGFASPVTSAVSGLGQSFVKLVLLSYYQDRITSRDVSEYLGVRLKHMAGIEERVMGSTVMFR
jgi:Zn-dependent peptidase ImmA (M78 family)